MRVRPPRLLWLLMLPLAAASPASASAPSSRPSARAVAATVTQMTGLSPSEVTVRNVCGPAAPGAAACQAQALVLRKDLSFVRGRVRRAPAARMVVTRNAAPTSATPAAAVQPPQAGTPRWLQQAYDMTYLSSIGGAGKTVAIVDAYDNPTAEQDLAEYRSHFGLPPCTTANGCFKKVNQDGGTDMSDVPYDEDWASEISLDLDAVSALCPNCHILLVEANSNDAGGDPDLETAVSTAATLGATQISASWAATIDYNHRPADTFSFPGVATVAATGDSGYVGVDYSNFPAAFADVTAAGGTSLAAASGGGGPRGFAESAWSLARDWSGALSGGGSGCARGVTKPAYQLDTGCTWRAYADLSADADPNTGLWVLDQGEWHMFGGTSLATPLIAAYYAATGVDAHSPQWAYANAQWLNDASSGSTGSCSIFYVCNARSGYDGPTGVGSISGAVVPGAPGVGGPSIGPGMNNTYTVSVDSSSATLQGGVYPNSLDTTYWWEYGTSTDYGQQTTPADIGAGQTAISVSGELRGLTGATTYHYRLVAHNSAGTTYGYDYTLTTAVQQAGASTVSPTVTPSLRNETLPSIAGSARRGVKLTAGVGTWNPSATSYSILWQRGDASGYETIAGANGTSYTPARADVGQRLRVIVIANNAAGSAVATSRSTDPVATNPPVRGTSPVITGKARQGSSLGFRQPLWRATTRDTRFSVQWKRCRRNGTGCQSIRGARAARYRLTAADAGHRILVSVTATNPDAAVTVSSRTSAVVSATRVLHRRRAHR